MQILCPPWRRDTERCNDQQLSSSYITCKHMTCSSARWCFYAAGSHRVHTESQTAAVHMLLLAVPAVAAGFLKAFGLAFLLWPFNLALPLARDLPRACITLRGIVSFYIVGARRGVQLLQARSQLGQQQDGGVSASSSSSSARGVARTREDAVAHAMLAFDAIY